MISFFQMSISKTNVLTSPLYPLLMGQRFDKQPTKPARKRRAFRLTFTYEYMFLSLWLISIYAIFALWNNNLMFFEMPTNADAQYFAKVLVGFWMINSIILLKFDSIAVIMEKESFAYAMKEYELLRSKWLSVEAGKVESKESEAMNNLNKVILADESTLGKIQTIAVDE